jgi:outer membrane protein OmpA-like peptidoglycan-associated protein
LKSSGDISAPLNALTASLKTEMKPLSKSLSSLNELSKGYWVRGPISQIKISATSEPAKDFSQSQTAPSGDSSAVSSVSPASNESIEKPESNQNPHMAKIITECQKQLADWLKSNPLSYEPAGYRLTKADRIKVVALKAEFLACGADLKLHIIGHTDSIGDENTNQLVSLARAEAIRNALVDEGLSPDKVSFEGKGEQLPIASNASRSGRAQNRRTEFSISSLKGAS